jgi:mannitol-specific phosphotransferase system IIBC component
MRLYIKLALATGVPFGVIMGVIFSNASVLPGVIAGVLFGIVMSAIIGTLQLRADRAAQRRATDHRRVRMAKLQETNSGDQSESDHKNRTASS